MVLLWVLLAVQDVRVEPRAEAGAVWIDGIVRFDERPLRGDRLDVRDDLGWTRPAFLPGVGLDVSLDRHVLGVSLRVSEFHGHAEFDVPATWNETVFAAGDRVRTELQIFDSAVEYRYWIVADSRVRFAAGISGRYVRMHLELGSDDDNLGAFVPELEVRAGWEFVPRLSAEARLAGFAYKGSNLRAQSASARLGLRWHISPSFATGLSLETGLFHVISSGGIQRNEVDLRSIAPLLLFEGRF
jgi:hypothetical protein